MFSSFDIFFKVVQLVFLFTSFSFSFGLTEGYFSVISQFQFQLTDDTLGTARISSCCKMDGRTDGWGPVVNAAIHQTTAEQHVSQVSISTAHQYPTSPIINGYVLPVVMKFPFHVTSYGRRAFAVAGPTAWNSLPEDMRDPEVSEDSYRQTLMTFLFVQYQCVWRIRDFLQEYAIQIHI